MFSHIEVCMLDSQCSRTEACVAGYCYPYCINECEDEGLSCDVAGICSPHCEDGKNRGS